MIQLIGLLVIATLGNRSPDVVCATYLVLVGFAALGAALFMDNLDGQKSNGAAMLEVLKYRDSWVISFLYIGTFGSFIGYSAAFPTLLKTVFGRGDIALTWAFALAALFLSAVQSMSSSL